MSNQLPSSLPPKRPNGLRLRLRRIFGWFVLLSGISLMILPGPGIPLVAFGIAILGTREPLVRRTGLFMRQLLRRLSRSSNPRLARIGTWLLDHFTRAQTYVHDFAAHHAAGRPLPRFLWLTIFACFLWLGVMVAASLHLVIW